MYMLYFFNRLRLSESSPHGESRTSRRSSWPCWNVCFPILTGTTKQERRVERCREGWRLGGRCVRYSVLDVFLVAEVAGPAVGGTVLLPVQAGGDGAPQPCDAHHSKLEHSPNPQNHRLTWSLGGVQSPNSPRPRRPHVHKTCSGCMAPPVLSISNTLRLAFQTVYQLNLEVTPVNGHVAPLEYC
jgi:hypothetical protein